MRFKEWLLTEGLSVSAQPEFQAVLPKAEAALRTYLGRFGGLDFRAAASRYRYVLTNVREGWSETRYEFTYDAFDKGKGNEEIAGSDHWGWEYNPNWDGRTGYRLYKTPKDALDDIPENPGLGYRGMSWEEWRVVERNGYIQSAGALNFHNQDGLTFYGYVPSTAVTYAGNFAPMAFKATPTKPGVVIAVPRSMLKDHTQDPNIPEGELAHQGTLPLRAVKEVYLVITTRSKRGQVEIVVSNDGRISEGSRSDIGLSYTIRRWR